MTWTKSSFCKADQPMCVEVDRRERHAFVRDSKDPDVELAFTGEEWDAFIAGVKAGEFD